VCLRACDGAQCEGCDSDSKWCDGSISCAFRTKPHVHVNSDARHLFPISLRGDSFCRFRSRSREENDFMMEIQWVVRLDTRARGNLPGVTR